MFSSKSQLRKRTPENGTHREEFLTLLVDEYLHSNSLQAKSQVLANLSNFAYDPINYEYIRNVGVLDVFLHVTKNEERIALVNFAIAGICNLCVDPLNAEYIVEQDGVTTLTNILKKGITESIPNILTILIYLAEEKSIIIDQDTLTVISELAKSEDSRLSNSAKIFIENTDYNSSSKTLQNEQYAVK